MNKRNLSILCATTALIGGCGNAGGGVEPVQATNPRMTPARAAELAKPDPNLTAEQNAAKKTMAEDQMKRDDYYGRKYGASGNR